MIFIPSIRHSFVRVHLNKLLCWATTTLLSFRSENCVFSIIWRIHVTCVASLRQKSGKSNYQKVTKMDSLETVRSIDRCCDTLWRDLMVFVFWWLSGDRLELDAFHVDFLGNFSW